MINKDVKIIFNSRGSNWRWAKRHRQHRGRRFTTSCLATFCGFHLNFFFPFLSRLPLKIHFLNLILKRETFHTPAAVPQQSGTHQAEEKILVMTSGGNRVMFLCTWSKLSTRARKTPTENNMAPRINRLVVLQSKIKGVRMLVWIGI